MKTFKTLLALIFLSGVTNLAFPQTGITIGPPRVYFAINPGQSQTEKVIINNPSKDFTLELGVSFEDWKYNEFGENVTSAPGTLPTSCVSWVSLPEAFFSLGPGETKELDITMSVPANYKDGEVPVQSALMYVTQLNPRDGVDKDGANIQISVRTGIKLYRRPSLRQIPEIDITNFTAHQDSLGNRLVLHFDNTGKIWADGVINVELFNQKTGEKKNLPAMEFFTMPGDQRKHQILLPAELVAGQYIATAIVNYGDASSVKIAELEFKHE